MAVTNEQIQQWFQANPNASDADIYSAMQTYKVDPTQLTNAMNFDQNTVQQRYQAQQAAAPQGIASLTSQATTPPPVTPPPPVQTAATVSPYTKYNDQDIVNYFQDFATKNTQGAYNANAYDVSQQLKDALETTKADPTQVSRILNSNAVVPIYGGSKAGGTDVNLKDFANEFAMATSKTPLKDANQRLTLDPTRAAQAAQNELDALFDPNSGTLMPIKNADFELGGKYYGQIGNRDKMIANYYNDPANKAKLDAAQKTVFDKYGVPENMRLAPRAIAPMLARTEVKPAAVVDPYDYATYEDYSAAQNAASLKAFQDKATTYKKYGIDIMGKEDPQQRQSTSGQVSLANLRSGLAGRNEQDKANFYGMTLENYQKALTSKQPDYFNTLRAPLARVAEQTARAAGMGNPDPKVVELAKKYPEIFAEASKEWANYLTKTYPKKKAGGGSITAMPDDYRAGGRVRLI
jgi:ubiquitin